MLVLKNETESKEEPVERGAKIKFNNYFEYAIGSGNSTQQGQCIKECNANNSSRSMCCVSVKMWPKDNKN